MAVGPSGLGRRGHRRRQLHGISRGWEGLGRPLRARCRVTSGGDGGGLQVRDVQRALLGAPGEGMAVEL